MRGANFNSANLNSSVFRFVNLARATLISSDTENSHFMFSDAHETVFSRASLIGANFNQTNMKGADLSGANLKGAFFLM